MPSTPLDQGLIAHWPFVHDREDHVGSGLVVRNHGESGMPGPDDKPGVAAFNGQDASLEVQDHPVLI